MNLMNVAQSQGGIALPDAMLAPLVGSIGEDRFAPSLAQFLHALCGANHFAAFRLGDGSRMLYGMSAVGISIDLSISEETVKTYRKRAYLRLGIGCEREYLGCWSRWRVRPNPRANNDALMD